MTKVDIYFVLNGYLNGEDGVMATTCSTGEQQKDGWYFIMDGMEDGAGPFMTKGLAAEAGREYNLSLREIVQLPGMEEDDVVEIIDNDTGLTIITTDWVGEGCEPVIMKVEKYAISELGGRDNIIRAFAAFARAI